MFCVCSYYTGLLCLTGILIIFCVRVECQGNMTICPVVCTHCLSNYIEGHVDSSTTVDLIHGCTNQITSSFKSNDTRFIENNVIFVKNENQGQDKIYLTLQEEEASFVHNNTSRPVERIYQFALGSSQPITWIISLRENLAKRTKFMATKGSKVENQASGTNLTSSTFLNNVLSKNSKKIMMNKLADEAFGQHSPVSSFIHLKDTDIVQMKIGITGKSDAPRLGSTRCKLDATSRPDLNLIQARSLKPVHLEKACSTKPARDVRNLLYAIDVAADERNKSIHLELDGIYGLTAETNVIIVLHSNNHVMWHVTGDVDKDISASLKFEICCNGSETDVSNLVFGDDTGSVHTREIPQNLSQASNDLIEVLSHIYVIPVTAYAKFASTVDFVRMRFEENDALQKNADRTDDDDDEDDDDDDDNFVSNLVNECTSSELVISLFRDDLQDYDVEESELEFGDGSCTTNWDDDRFSVTAVSGQCGLQVNFNQLSLKMQLHAGTTTTTYNITCQTHTDVKLRLYEDKERTKQFIASNVVSWNIRPYIYAEVTMATNHAEGNDVGFDLDWCYLKSLKDTTIHTLIKGNCPTSESGSFFIQPSKQDILKQAFGISLQHVENVRGNFKSFQLFCDVKKCLRSSGRNQHKFPKCGHLQGVDCTKPVAATERSQVTVMTTITSRAFMLGFDNNSGSKSTTTQSVTNRAVAASLFLVGIAVIIFLVYLRSRRRRRVSSRKKSIYHPISPAYNGVRFSKREDMAYKRRDRDKRRISDTGSLAPLMSAFEEGHVVQMTSQVELDELSNNRNSDLVTQSESSSRWNHVTERHEIVT